MPADETVYGQSSVVPRYLPGPCQELLNLQHVVIARWQVAQAGLSGRVADPQLHAGRWQPLYRGVYATFTGPPSRMAVLWAAVLRGGPGAALSYETAAELDQLVDRPARSIHVSVCFARQITISGREGGGRIPGSSFIAVVASARRVIPPARRPVPGSKRRPSTSFRFHRTLTRHCRGSSPPVGAG